MSWHNYLINVKETHSIGLVNIIYIKKWMHCWDVNKIAFTDEVCVYYYLLPLKIVSKSGEIKHRSSKQLFIST